MPLATYAPAREWSFDKRCKKAIDAVLVQDWSVNRASQHFGVSRNSLALAVKTARAKREEEAAKADLAEKAQAQSFYSEQRRLPPPDDFDRMYFGHFICPDCHVRHDSPSFHSELRSTLNDPLIRRSVTNVPPYHAKSTVASIRDSIYKLCRNPNWRRIIVSDTEKFAKTILVSIQELLTNPEMYEGAERNLIDDWGPFVPDRGRRWSTTQMYVAQRSSSEKDPSILVVGAAQQIYGRRAEDIVFDDIANLKNQRNPDQVIKLLEWIDKEAFSRIGKTGSAHFVGTRVHPGDIYSALMNRAGYKVMRLPVILDEIEQTTLWPEHFPWHQVMQHKGEMSDKDFQLVYMNTEKPGAAASFTPEIVEPCLDETRIVGHHLPHWRLIAGVDPAGGNKGSGYTSFMLVGVDPITNQRFIVDHYAEKSMRAPALKDFMLEWTARYGIYQWVAESNGVQSNLIQYNDEIIRPLAMAGVRVIEHQTQGNKWDPQFGVESIAPLFAAEMYSIPWGNVATRQVFQPLLDELYGFPYVTLQDRVMSLWFAELGCRKVSQQAQMPLFDSRATKRWPNRVLRHRRVVDFGAGEVRQMKIEDQTPSRMYRGARPAVGRPVRPGQPLPEPPRQPKLINVEEPHKPWSQ